MRIHKSRQVSPTQITHASDLAVILRSLTVRTGVKRCSGTVLDLEAAVSDCWSSGFAGNRRRGNERALKDSDAWALLERIVNSPRFQRAARLREFLLYVGRRSIREHCDQINEQEIGTEVFGRPPNYDTNIDNIVRVNATEVRKRVEAYFEAEGAREPVILEIPRGSYKPVFRNRAAEAIAGTHHA